jgi:hypothetical protein
MNKKERLEELKSLIQHLKNAPYINSYTHIKEKNNPELNKIYEIALQLCLSENDFLSLYRENSDCPKYNRIHNTKSVKYFYFRNKKQIDGNLPFSVSEIFNYKSMPAHHKDNNGIYVGNGGSNINSVRYPSKKRSKRVWAQFYRMFPSLAIKDNWDGQTSDRMK